MKTYNKLILSIFGSAFVAGTVSAQTFTVTGQGTQLSTSSNLSAVAIDPATGQTTINAETPASQPSVTISATPGSVATNGAVTVSWSTSAFTGAVNCTRISSPVLSGWNESSTLASGSTSVTMPSTPGQVSLTLSCTGSNGSATSPAANVTVTQPGQTVDCSNRRPGVSGAPGVPGSSRILVNREFSSIWGTNFPGIFGPTIVNTVADGTVVAYAFVAPPNNDNIEGWFQTVPTPTASGRGTAATGLSECPGDISNAVPTCEPSFGKTRNEWTTTGRLNACNLIPGRQYYYNLSVLGSCTFGVGGSPGATCAFGIESRRY